MYRGFKECNIRWDTRCTLSSVSVAPATHCYKGACGRTGHKIQNYANVSNILHNSERCMNSDASFDLSWRFDEQTLSTLSLVPYLINSHRAHVHPATCLALHIVTSRYLETQQILVTQGIVHHGFGKQGIGARLQIKLLGRRLASTCISPS